MNTKNPARIFLVDDHPLVRESLKLFIERQPDMTVCGEADNSSAAMRGVISTEPDLVVIDISLKESSGLELLKAIKLRIPSVDLVVLSMHDEKLYAERCIRAGARAYVMKGEATTQIISAIREVRLGNLAVSSAIAVGLAGKLAPDQNPLGGSPLESLSDRELEVFSLLGRGLETRQVANALQVNIKTVQVYCARIKQKLRLATGAELVREAIRWHERQPPGSHLNG